MDRKTLLDKGYSEEQVTDLLNLFHSNENKEEITKLQQDLAKANQKMADYDTIKAKLDAIDKEKMTREEKIAMAEKEANEKLAKANKFLNATKAKSILIEAGMTSDSETLDTIVAKIASEDETSTIDGATVIANAFKNLKEETVKKTKEELANIDIKPKPSNVPGDDGVMTWEKFSKMSESEQTKFANEHPEEFQNL